ncbi:MAG: hypothetical protein GY913_07095 [Proteobacteria bacterium]|nr:hypothetical protein [Pseudomonadota bacterium]MCP4916674.1 hypothetical protein [Pseudomonadota bacterium]
MSRLSPELRQLLGVEDVEHSTPIEKPRSEAGEGFTPAPLLALATLFLEGPRPREVPTGEATVQLARAATQPTAFVLQTEEPVEVLKGTVHHDEAEQAWFFDTQEQVVLRIGDHALVLKDGAGALHQLVDIGLPPALQLPDWPGTTALTGAWSVPSWLETEAERLGSSSAALDRLPAAGLLARLWTPRDREERGRALKATLSGDATVQRHVAAWLDEVRDWTDVDAAAMARVELHEERLDGLPELATEPLLLDLIRERDALQSLSASLHLAGRPCAPALRAALAAADERWAGHLSLVGALFDPSAMRERLRAVSSQEPESWWGHLA